jgi:transporter family-2 protein
MPEQLRSLAFCGLAMLAGTSLVVQATLNTNLRSKLASWSWTGFVSYLGGTLTMLAILLIQRESFPSRAAIAESPWPLWIGGFFGAVYIVLAIVLLPRLGAAAVVAFVVAGQMLTSLAFDHYGVLGLPHHPVNVPRLLGALLIIGGVALTRLG